MSPEEQTAAIRRGCDRLAHAITIAEEIEREALYPTCEKCGARMQPVHEPPFFVCDCEDRRIKAIGELYHGVIVDVARQHDDPDAILYLRIRRPNGEIVRLETIEDQIIFYRDPDMPQPAHLRPEPSRRR